MNDSYEDWIMGMEDEEYIDRLESTRDNGGFSDRQKSIALNIRQPPEDSELQMLEREQEGEPIRVEQPIGREERVYDTRDIKVATNQEGDSIVTINANESPRQIQDRLSEPIQSQEIRKQSIASRIKSAIVNAFRRKK